jgi:hypothetical protein
MRTKSEYAILPNGMAIDPQLSWWSSDRADEHLRNTIAALRGAASTISIARDDTVSVGEIERGLVEVLRLNQIGEVLGREVDAQAVVSLLSTYDFMRLRPQFLCEIELADSIVPGDISSIFVTEAQVKFRGEIWRVHKNDADPFPSSPHAHNYRLRIKMHLGNGDLYCSNEKVSSGRIRKQDLLDFRGRVQQANSSIDLPPLSDA